jgi:hypothetical protein
MVRPSPTARTLLPAAFTVKLHTTSLDRLASGDTTHPSMVSAFSESLAESQAGITEQFSGRCNVGQIGFFNSYSSPQV